MYAIISAPASNTLSGVSLFPDGSGASFRVWAPNALSVSVRLKAVDNDPFVSLPLTPDTLNPTYWSASISNVAAGHYYQFELVNRGGDTYNPGRLPFLRTDPCARQVTSSDPTLPALVVDPTPFAFVAPFRTPSFENFIIYQAHIGSFAGRNDGLAVFVDPNGGTANFAQCEEKLDYISSMHFNAIQFLPTGEYRGVEGEAYNPSDYYAPEVLYGSPDTLRHLIDACHRRGLT